MRRLVESCAQTGLVSEGLLIRVIAIITEKVALMRVRWCKRASEGEKTDEREVRANESEREERMKMRGEGERTEISRRIPREYQQKLPNPGEN